MIRISNRTLATRALFSVSGLGLAMLLFKGEGESTIAGSDKTPQSTLLDENADEGIHTATMPEIIREQELSSNKDKLVNPATTSYACDKIRESFVRAGINSLPKEDRYRCFIDRTSWQEVFKDRDPYLVEIVNLLDTKQHNAVDAIYSAVFTCIKNTYPNDFRNQISVVLENINAEQDDEIWAGLLRTWRLLLDDESTIPTVESMVRRYLIAGSKRDVAAPSARSSSNNDAIYQKNTGLSLLTKGIVEKAKDYDQLRILALDFAKDSWAPKWIKNEAVSILGATIPLSRFTHSELHDLGVKSPQLLIAFLNSAFGNHQVNTGDSISSILSVEEALKFKSKQDFESFAKLIMQYGNDEEIGRIMGLIANEQINKDLRGRIIRSLSDNKKGRDWILETLTPVLNNIPAKLPQYLSGIEKDFFTAAAQLAPDQLLLFSGLDSAVTFPTPEQLKNDTNSYTLQLAAIEALLKANKLSAAELMLIAQRIPSASPDTTEGLAYAAAQKINANIKNTQSDEERSRLLGSLSEIANTNTIDENTRIASYCMLFDQAAIQNSLVDSDVLLQRIREDNSPKMQKLLWLYEAMSAIQNNRTIETPLSITGLKPDAVKRIKEYKGNLFNLFQSSETW